MNLVKKTFYVAIFSLILFSSFSQAKKPQQLTLDEIHKTSIEDSKLLKELGDDTTVKFGM